METCLERGSEVYVSIWTRQDIIDIIEVSLDNADMVLTDEQMDLAINKIFVWMDNQDECNNPPTYDSIQSYFENSVI